MPAATSAPRPYEIMYGSPVIDCNVGRGQSFIAPFIWRFVSNSHAVRMQIHDICRRHGVTEISPELHTFLSRATSAHIGDLLKNAAGIAAQRKDANRRLPGMVADPSANLMQQLAAIRYDGEDRAYVRSEHSMVWPLNRYISINYHLTHPECCLSCCLQTI